MLKEGQVRIPSGCAIAAIIDKKGNPINGSEIIKSIALMHDRSNGLGGGFAAYGKNSYKKGGIYRKRT